ncbi:DNA-directed RNA polymerase subunit beta, partial [Candidatus Hodgkinia cicadicola]
MLLCVYNMLRTRFNLSINTTDREIIDQGQIHKRLYTNALWGSFDRKGIKKSKLMLNLQPLFPIMFEYWTLELTGINNYVKSERLTTFELCFDVVQYRLIDEDVMFIGQHYDFNLVLMDLPRLSKDEVLTIDGVMKTLVMQLIRQPSVLFDRKNGSINLKNKNGGYLKIVKSEIMHDNYKSDLLISLLKLKTKYSHIFKSIIGTNDIVFYKGKWCYLLWNNSLKENYKYGLRRRFRSKIIITNYTEGIKGVIVGSYIDRTKTPFVNIGERIILDKHIALTYSSSLVIARSSKILNIVNALSMKRSAQESEITWRELDDVDLSLVGREFLNDLIGNSLDFGLDLLTKRDIILIWNKVSIGQSNFRDVEDDVRVIRGSGDAIIDIVKTCLRHALHVGGGNVLLDDDSIMNKLSFYLERMQGKVNNFFVSSSLCQYLDQVNSLSELSHRNKVTCMGEGGLTSKNAEVTLRDTKIWQFAKICPIESPEGQSIGLVLALSSYASVDINGHIITAYFRTNNRSVSNNIVYLNHFESKRLNVGLPNNEDQDKWAMCLNEGKAKIIESGLIDLNLVSNSQVFSPAVCLIPFLGHNDPTRALMAANMQKQAIPLLNPCPPLVGTGEEYNVMKSTGHNIIAHENGIVVSSDANRVVVYELKNKKKRAYFLPKTDKTNQGMCHRMRTVVNPGQRLRPGDVIAECQSSCDGEISLGVNLLAAFMCWNGYNFEDSVILSEDVINKGYFKSLHIIDLETKVMRTEFGDEWLSADIIEIPMKHRKWLDANGIVKKGSIVSEGDVLVGKLVYKADVQKKKEELKEISGIELGKDKEEEEERRSEIDKEEKEYKMEEQEEQDKEDEEEVEKRIQTDEKFKKKIKTINRIKDVNKEEDDGDDEVENREKEDEEMEMFEELIDNTSLRVPNGIDNATVIEIERSSEEDIKVKPSNLDDYIYRYNAATKKYIRRCCVLIQTIDANDYFKHGLLSSKHINVKSGLELLHKNYLNYLRRLENDLFVKLNNRLTSENQCDKEKVLEIIKIKLLVS